MILKGDFKKYVTIFIFILFFLTGTISQYIRIKEHKQNDHWVYYRTAKRIDARDVAEIYSLKDGAFPFRYSPPTLMLFSWMSYFSEINSRRIWLIAQSLFILASFPFLYRLLLLINSPSPIYAISFSFFLFYRYFLDSLYCGQVSGMVFFTFVFGLYFWAKEKKSISNLGILFLASLKIVPGFMFAINFLTVKTKKEFFSLIAKLALAALLILLIYFIWFIAKFGFSNIEYFSSMFKAWIVIALSDKDYFDGSTSKSQALRAVLLRIFGESSNTEIVWKITSIISLLSLYLYWYKLKMDSIKVRIYSYLLGILSFVLLMPESLPYQYFKLLIPSIFIMNEFFVSPRKEYKAVLLFILIFCSLSTADLTGHYWADNVQSYSLPFIASLLIGHLLIREISKS